MDQKIVRWVHALRRMFGLDYTLGLLKADPRTPATAARLLELATGELNAAKAACLVEEWSLTDVEGPLERALTRVEVIDALKAGKPLNLWGLISDRDQLTKPDKRAALLQELGLPPDQALDLPDDE